MKPLALADVDRPFLKNIGPKHLKILNDCAMRCHFGPGEVIFHEGDPANRFYLIEKGKVALISANKRDRQQIQVIGAGEVLGWSWLFPPYVWHFDARTIESTDAIFLYGTRLREACEEDHDLGYELMQRIAAVLIERLQATRHQLIESKPGRPDYYISEAKGG